MKWEETMAKDDYEVIVYRMLVYLYAVLKREIAFDAVTFAEAVRKDVKSSAYFDKALEMMQEEGLIRGLVFTQAWGGDVILASGIRDAEITPAGIRHLKENARMKIVGRALAEAKDIIATLATILQIV